MYIKPIHIPRTDPLIQLADTGSRAPDIDKDSWELDDQSVQEMQDWAGGCKTDLFADCYNHKAEQYCSLYDYGQPRPIAIDAFSTSWSAKQMGAVYACPPINEIVHTVRKIKKDEATGVLVVPRWHTATYWTSIYQGRELLSPFKEAKIFTPQIRRRDWARPYMQGSKMQFLALLF